MSESLKNIQRCAKFILLLVNIFFVFAIIGAIGCAVSAIVLFVVHVFGGDTSWFTERIFSDASISVGTAIANTVVSAMSAAAHIVVLPFARRYLKGELEDGTPFSQKGAKNMLNLGIAAAVTPIVASAISGSVCEGICALISDTVAPTETAPWSVMIGVIVALISYLVRYGAELEERVAATETAQIEEGEREDTPAAEENK